MQILPQLLAHPAQTVVAGMRLCIVNNEVPTYFFEWLRNQVPFLATHGFIYHAVNEIPMNDLVTQMSTYSVIDNPVYVVYSFDKNGAASVMQLVTTLEQYATHATVFLVVSPDCYAGLVLPSWHTVSLQDPITAIQLGHLVRLSGASLTPRIELYIRELMKQYKKLTVQQGCIIARYLPVFSLDTASLVPFFDPLVLHNQESLFNLSQLFFKKQVREFFIKWRDNKERYSDAFWVSFWADQVYHAAVYVRYRGAIPSADLRAFRLPFSFINSDWRSFSLAELVNAHTQLCDIDYAIKNGMSTSVLDAFFLQFFAQ